MPAPPTSWTERSAPASTSWTEDSPGFSSDVFLEGPIQFRKSSNHFYIGMRGIVNGLIPTKDSTTFFYTLAGASPNGSYFLGRTVDNFVIAEPR